jgi:hypothetical protein
METLADRFIASPDFAERHEIDIPAAPEVVWEAWQRWQMSDPPLIARVLFKARSLISHLRYGHAHQDLPRMFIPLAQERPKEIVEGLVGRWWTFGAERNQTEIAGPEEFRAFAEPGYAKATIGLRFIARPGERTRAITETRVMCTDVAARRSMRRYWVLIRPFSGLIRILMLRKLRRMALR